MLWSFAYYGAFTYDVRCFGGIFDLPKGQLISEWIWLAFWEIRRQQKFILRSRFNYPNQILYYVSLCSKIRCSLIYLPKNLMSNLNAPLAPGATLEVTVAKDRYNNATRNEVVTTNTNWTIPLTPLVSIYIK